MNAPGYEQLSEVLRAAFDQAAYGKGADRGAVQIVILADMAAINVRGVA